MQKALGAEIFINVRPMNSVPRAGYFPVFALSFYRMQQAGVPSDGNRYSAPVKKIHNDCIIGKVNVPDAFTGFRFLSSHAMPPIIFFGSPW